MSTTMSAIASPKINSMSNNTFNFFANDFFSAIEFHFGCSFPNYDNVTSFFDFVNYCKIHNLQKMRHNGINILMMYIIAMRYAGYDMRILKFLATRENVNDAETGENALLAYCGAKNAIYYDRNVIRLLSTSQTLKIKGYDGWCAIHMYLMKAPCVEFDIIKTLAPVGSDLTTMRIRNCDAFDLYITYTPRENLSDDILQYLDLAKLPRSMLFSPRYYEIQRPVLTRSD